LAVGINEARVVAQKLEGADHAGGTAELVEGQKAERVAHDDRNAGTQHARAQEPAIGDGEGGEAQKGLGLAAAGREEEQIDQLAISVRLLGDAVEIKQDVGELERAPGRRFLLSRITGSAGCPAAQRRGDGRLAIWKSSRARGSAHSR
jgi:hypothetical protein